MKAHYRLTFEENPVALSLEKSWHGIQFVLTGTAWGGEPPLNFLMAGQTVGDIDVGFGPARVLLSPEVLLVNRALSRFTEAIFDQNFDLLAIEEAKIYPQIWYEPREELLEEYLFYFRSLQQFILRAAENGQAIIMALR